MKKSKSTNGQALAARRFLAPVRRGLRAGISAAHLAGEATRLSGKYVATSTVYRWLLNRGKPVEPGLGAGLCLRNAFENLRRKAMSRRAK